jgi:hypothetical protein
MWGGTISEDYLAMSTEFRSGEIRVYGLSGDVERTIAFTEADRKL